MNGDTSDMIKKVKKRKKKEREKVRNMPEALGVSVEEYDSWDPTTQLNPDHTSSILKIRLNRSVKRKKKPANSSKSEKRKSEDLATPVAKFKRRSAATIANSCILEMVRAEEGPL